MKMPPRMAARMAGAVVAAVLIAAAGLSAADDAPLLLLPEAADEGASGAVAPPEGEGSAIGGSPAKVVPAEAVPARPAAGDTRAGDTRAGDEEAAAGSNAPDSGSMNRAEASPEPASRLLRALAETPKAPASPGGGSAGSAPVYGTGVYGTSVYAAEGCPRALLRRLLAGAADDAGALTALGIEREVLTLCRERQEIVTGLFAAEAQLRELRVPQEPTAPAAAAAVVPKTAPAVRQDGVSGQRQPSPLRAALAATAETLVPGKAEGADPRAGELMARARVSPARVSPRYGWFSIIGTAGALRAGITDGTGVWFVREGDAVPGGGTVASITARPPGVRIAAPEGSDDTLLSWRALPGVGR